MVHLSEKHKGPASRRGLSCVHRYAKAGDRGWRSLLPPDRAMPARWAGAGRLAVRDVGLSLCQRSSCGGRRLVHCDQRRRGSCRGHWGRRILQGCMRGFHRAWDRRHAVWRACRSVVSPSFGLTRPMRPRFGMSNRRPSSLRLPRSQDRNGRAQLSSPGRCAPIPRETRKPRPGRPLLRGGPAGAVRSPPVNDSHRGRDGRGPRNERGHEHGYHWQLHRERQRLRSCAEKCPLAPLSEGLARRRPSQAFPQRSEDNA